MKFRNSLISKLFCLITLLPLLWLVTPRKELMFVMPDEDGKMLAIPCVMGVLADDEDVKKRVEVCIPLEVEKKIKFDKCPDV